MVRGQYQQALARVYHDEYSRCVRRLPRPGGSAACRGQSRPGIELTLNAAQTTITPQTVKPASLKLNAVSNAVSYAVAALTALVLSPFLVHRLGDSRYGVMSLSAGLLGYYGLLDLGIRGAVGYFVARYRAEQNPEANLAVIRNAFWVLSLVASVVMCIGGFVAFNFPKLFNIGRADPREASLAVAIATAGFALTLPFSVPSAILNGLRRIDLIARAEMVCKTVAACGIYLALLWGGGLVEVTLAQVSGSILTWCAWIVELRRLGFPFRVWPPSIQRRTIKDLATVGSATVIINIGTSLITQVQPIIVGSALGTAAVTYFTLGRYLPVQFYSALAALSITLTTAFTHLYCAGLKSDLNRVFMSASRIIGALSCFVAAGIAVFGESFLTLWVGTKYTRAPATYASGTIMLIMLAANLPRTFLNVPTQFLLGSRKLRFLTILRSAEALATVPLCILLVRPLGPAGVAVGTLLPTLACHVFFLLPFTLKTLDIPMRDYSRGVLRPAAAIGIGTAAAGLVALRAVHPGRWSILCAEIAIVSGLVLAFSWRLVLRETERASVLGRISRLSAGLRVRF